MTCHVTGAVVAPDGTAFADQVLTLWRDPVSMRAVSGRGVAPETQVIMTDAAGLVDFEIEPGSYIGQGGDPARPWPFVLTVPVAEAADFADCLHVEVERSTRFRLYRGTDFVCEFDVPDEDGNPADLIGWSVSIYEPSAAITGILTATLLAEAPARVRLEMPWQPEFETGRSYGFYLQFTSPTGRTVSWPQMGFDIQ